MGVGTAGEANAIEFGLPHARPAAVRQLKILGADLKCSELRLGRSAPPCAQSREHVLNNSSQEGFGPPKSLMPCSLVGAGTAGRKEAISGIQWIRLVQRNVSLFDHRRPLFEFEPHERRGVGWRTASRLNCLLGD
jgi:hypothetical protein